jgi:ABC-type Fe3+ transport system permease subunit
MIKKIFIVTYLVFLLGILVINFLGSIRGYGIFISPFTYWTVLVGWLYVNYERKIKSKKSFVLAFGFFVISAVFGIFGARFVSEIIMKISFIGWVIGIVQALIEYKKDQKSE